MKRKISKYVYAGIIAGAFAMLLSLMPTNHVMAAEVAAKVVTKDNVETSYTSVSEAVSAMTDGATLYLQEDSSEEIQVSSTEQWKLNTNGYTYSGNIFLETEAGIEVQNGSVLKAGFVIDGNYSDAQTYVVIDDGVKADWDAKTIIERYTKPEQLCREYKDTHNDYEWYIVETTDDLPYKVNGTLYASSARATYELADGDTLYIVKDTDRGIAFDNSQKSYDVDAGDCVVDGDIYLPLTCNLISGTFVGEIYWPLDKITFTEKCRFTEDMYDTLIEYCTADQKIVQDADGYFIAVKANDQDKIVHMNGQSYVYVNRALHSITDENMDNTISLSADYKNGIFIMWDMKVKFDFGDHYLRNYIENHGDLEILSGKFDGDEKGDNTYIGTTCLLTISGGYYGNVDFKVWGEDDPGYLIKGGTFSPYAYNQIKDYIADGYQAVSKDGNYVIQKKSEVKLTGWQKIDGKWYYYDSNGAKTTGWQKVSGKWYYMNKDGIMLTGWQKINGKWYYMNTSGVMLTGWQKINGKWYYMNTSGAMLTGWQKIGGKWYYMNGSGAMLTGWQKIGGKWYYMNGSGVMVTGWLKLGSKWYYLNGSGVMVTGRQKIGGKWYQFNASGVWIK